jgi:hypothetical protein
MVAAEIAAALGAAYPSGRWWRCLCPIHGSRSGHSTTLALRDGDRGLIVYCHAGCSAADILAELRRRGLLDRFDQRNATRPSAERRDRKRCIDIARRIWGASLDAHGTPVAYYLGGRGIEIEPPPVLRWAPRCWHRDTCAELPAMVARIDGPDGAMIGVHRTYLRRDERGQWHRRDRASLGRIARGGVRLTPAAETMLVGEGIETCLSALQATGMPAWSALSTAGLTGLILPPSVRAIVILADNDRNNAGAQAAYAAAARWVSEGRRVRVAMPSEPGTDFNHVLAGRAYSCVSEMSDAA